MKKIVFLVPMFLILAAGCGKAQPQPPAQNNTNNQTTMNNDLRPQLEIAYNKVRAVINAKGNPAAMNEVFEGNASHPLPTSSDAEWSSTLNFFDKGYPDLSKVHFVSDEQDGYYAYYYAWVDTDKADKMNVWAYVFHKAGNGEWKLTGYSQFKYTDKSASAEENNKNVQNQIPDLKAQALNAMNHK